MFGKKNQILFYKLKLKKYFALFQTYLLEKKVPEPYLSFKTIYEEADKRSLLTKNSEIKAVMSHSIVKKLKIKKMLRLRSRHYPIQYICKEWPFKQIILEMKPPILIPRFETEQLISILIQKLDAFQYFQKLKQQKKQLETAFKFAELGCGTGAIGISIVDQLAKRNIKFQGKMIDIQSKAVQLTKRNLIKNNFQRYGKNIQIYQQNMLQFLQQQQNFTKLSLLISNPPYISKNQYDSKKFQKQVKKYESKTALVGDQNLNENGLFYIQKIIQKWKQNPTFILALQYGGEKLDHLGCQIQKCVVEDYYKKRRFIILLPKQINQ